MRRVVHSRSHSLVYWIHRRHLPRMCTADFGARVLVLWLFQSPWAEVSKPSSPSGMIVDFYGPVPGRKSDSHMLERSGFEGRMRLLNQTLGMQRADYHVYGDPAYALSRYITRGFKGVMNPQQAALSRKMNVLRVSVEWGIMLVVRDWRFIEWRST